MPKGFQASAIKAGLKSSDESDLALILAPKETICAGTFTKSLIRASCVDLCQERIEQTDGKVRAVIINSGQANACTGERGLLDNLQATKCLADLLGLRDEEVLICSTGRIGERIPINKLINALDPLVKELSFDGGNEAAKAILTTDLIEKEISLEACLGERTVRIGGMAKGSGMIHPEMATMLAYITCDACISQPLWQAMLQRVVDLSFNAITVDGDTSTNDSVIAFASGDYLDVQYLDLLELGLLAVAQHLAQAIAKDGEGANCLFQVQVEGARNDADARRIAKCICGSSLVKSAVHGSDPNWGRILASAGRSGAYVDSKKISLWLGPNQLMKDGDPILFDQDKASLYMKERMKGALYENESIDFRLVVGKGEGTGFAWGCDLSDQYVRINADYTT